MTEVFRIAEMGVGDALQKVKLATPNAKAGDVLAAAAAAGKAERGEGTPFGNKADVGSKEDEEENQSWGHGYGDTKTDPKTTLAARAEKYGKDISNSVLGTFGGVASAASK